MKSGSPLKMNSDGRDETEHASNGCLKHELGVGAVAVLSAIAYAACSLIKFVNFQAGAYDLVIFDQAVRSYSNFQAPISMIKGVHNGFGPGFSVLGDHWSPILALLAPLYWISNTPQMLLVVQALLFAGAIPFLWIFTRRALGTRAAYFVAVSYAISWPVVEAVAFDFHEVAFVPMLTAVMLERHQAGKAPHVLLSALALMCVKEDMGLLVAGVGLYLLTRQGWRLLGAAFLFAGSLFSWVASQILIPLFGGRADYYWAYGELGATPKEALVNALAHPLNTVGLLVTPSTKAVTLLLLFGMTLFAALLSPLVLATLPIVLERMLAGSFPNWWADKYHYNAFIVVVLFVAGVDGIRRVRLWGERARRSPDLHAGRHIWSLPVAASAKYARLWPVGVLVFGLACLPAFSLKLIADPQSYRFDAREEALRKAVSIVPDNALVEAANEAAPALSSRTRVLLWDREPRWAPWVVADANRRIFPFQGVAEQRNRIAFLVHNGYEVVFAKEDIFVLARSGHRGGEDGEVEPA